MRSMVEISPTRKIFTYEEALATFPDIRRRTEAAVRQMEAVVNQVQSREELTSRQEEIEEACQGIFEGWARDIHDRHGCEVKGLWLVDWDSGDGYYCWKYPEATLHHFHGYDEGFDGRIPII